MPLSPRDTATIVDRDTPGRVTVEAPTAEAAIAAVHDHLGAAAEIVEADRVLRGGLWGFFPKQMVQLTAQTSAPATPDATRSTADVVVPARSADPTSLGSVLARLQAEEDAAEEGLGEALRRHLGVTISEDTTVAGDTPVGDAASATAEEVADWQPARIPVAVGASVPTAPAAPAPAAPAPAAPAPASAVTTAPAALTPADPLPLDDVEYARPAGTPWSGRGLLMLGLPRGFVDAVLAQAPADDAAWTYAVARVLAPLCRPLPSGPAAIVGPKAERLSRALGVPLVRLSAAPQGTASFGVACTDSTRAHTWLAEHRGARWTQLVIGGADWRGLLFEGPLAVSWVGDDMLGEAIRVAHDLGMVLAPGVRADGTLVEPAPIELAMMLRAMLGGRR